MVDTIHLVSACTRVTRESKREKSNNNLTCRPTHRSHIVENSIWIGSCNLRWRFEESVCVSVCVCVCEKEKRRKGLRRVCVRRKARAKNCYRIKYTPQRVKDRADLYFLLRLKGHKSFLALFRSFFRHWFMGQPGWLPSLLFFPRLSSSWLPLFVSVLFSPLHIVIFPCVTSLTLCFPLLCLPLEFLFFLSLTVTQTHRQLSVSCFH